MAHTPPNGRALTRRDFRLLRLAQRRTLADVARAVSATGTPLNPSQLCRIERGQIPLTPAHAVGLVRVLLGHLVPEDTP